jgi:CxxC-x17-CxxC domain-containing protein
MKDFKRGGGKYAAKKPGKGGFNKYRGKDVGKPHGLHKATCTTCGKECEVPFKPIDGKPVFCRDCYKKQDHAGDTERPARSFGAKPSFRKEGFRKDSYTPSAAPASDETKKQLAEINVKLDKILAVLADLELDSDDVE